MPERVLVDNDVILKAAAYSLTSELLFVTNVEGHPPSFLGVAQFVTRKRLVQGANLRNREAAQAALEHLLASAGVVEPNDNELQLAADFEEEANRQNLELDGGESQLLAVLINRNCNLLVTGDKRAIRAISAVARTTTEKRIACLEQLMTSVLKVASFSSVRQRVCDEPEVDRTMTICFSCFDGSFDIDRRKALDGLASYIRHLEGAAPGVLFEGEDLPGVSRA